MDVTLFCGTEKKRGDGETFFESGGKCRYITGKLSHGPAYRGAE
jgi:hypothetical protein